MYFIKSIKYIFYFIVLPFASVAYEIIDFFYECLGIPTVIDRKLNILLTYIGCVLTLFFSNKIQESHLDFFLCIYMILLMCALFLYLSTISI